MQSVEHWVGSTYVSVVLEVKGGTLDFVILQHETVGLDFEDKDPSQLLSLLGDPVASSNSQMSLLPRQR